MCIRDRTQITNDLKNTIAIGATANNDVINGDATLFAKWNMGLTDRYQQDVFDKQPNKCIINGAKITPKVDSKTKANNNSNNQDILKSVAYALNPLISEVARGLKLLYVEQRNRIAKEKEEKKRQAIADEKALMLNYNAYLDFVFTTLALGTAYQRQKDTRRIRSTTTYFRSNPKVVERGFNALRNKYITENKRKLEDKGQPSSNIGSVSYTHLTLPTICSV